MGRYDDTSEPFRAVRRRRLVERLLRKEFENDPERGRAWLGGWFKDRSIETVTEDEAYHFFAAKLL